jgi:hypothetical protein
MNFMSAHSASERMRSHTELSRTVGFWRKIWSMVFTQYEWSISVSEVEVQ